MQAEANRAVSSIRALMISSGDRILRSPISNEVDRHAEYASRIGSLDMLVYSRPRYGLTTTSLGSNLVVHPVQARTRLGFIWRAYRQGLRLCQERKTDLITAQDPFDTAITAVLLGRRLRIPVEIQNHSSFYADPGWSRERPIFRLLKQIGRQTLKRAALLRVLNDAERNAYVQMGLPEDRIRILPTPVDASGFLTANRASSRMREQWGWDPAHVVVAWVGRMVAEKRLMFWLNVASRVAKKVDAARFVLIGDGPERRALEQRAVALGLEERVVFTGLVPHDELPECLAAADLYLHTSRLEGFGKVIVEAQAAGLPVVAVSAFGPSSVVVDGETGYLVPADESKVAGAVETLCRDEALRRRMGRAAQENVRRRFGYEDMIDAIVCAWREVVEKRT